MAVGAHETDPLVLTRSDPLGRRDGGISFSKKGCLYSEQGDSEEAKRLGKTKGIQGRVGEADRSSLWPAGRRRRTKGWRSCMRWAMASPVGSASKRRNRGVSLARAARGSHAGSGLARQRWKGSGTLDEGYGN